MRRRMLLLKHKMLLLKHKDNDVIDPGHHDEKLAEDATLLST